MYAVIAVQGHQYIVQEGMTLTVDKLDVAQGEVVNFDDVYCVFDQNGQSVSLGKPLVNGANVQVKVVEHKKGPKTRVLKFQGKKRYQRVKGFRPQQTLVSVEKIVA